MNLIIIGIIVAIVCIITRLICDHKYDSEWQEIIYSGSSIEPKEIYICKQCNYKANLNYHYCNNCGAEMKNGLSYHCYSDKIELSNWENKE